MTNNIRQLPIQEIKKQTKNKSFLWLSLTFFTIVFFLLAAIRPTILTIVKLKKEIEENEKLSQQMQRKIDLLVKMQEFYYRNMDRFFLLDEAVPQRQSLGKFVSKIESIASDSGVTLEGALIDNEAKRTPKEEYINMPFTITVSGDFGQSQKFYSIINNLRRLLTINNLSYSTRKQEDKKVIKLTIKGEVYYYDLGAKTTK